MFESLGTPVVGIGHFAFGVIIAEGTEEAHAVPLGGGRREGEHAAMVVFVHGEDEIEGVQIAGDHLAGAAGEIVAAGDGGGAHAGVGAVTLVHADGAGGIDFDLIGEAGGGDHLGQDAFTGGRTADVAHTDEEDAEREWGHEGSRAG